MDDLKQCTRCGEWKLRTEYTRRQASKDGLAHSCRTCAYGAWRAWYEKHRAERIERNRAYNMAHRERLEAIRRANRPLNADRNRERRQVYREVHRERDRISRRAHYEANREALLAKAKARRQASPVANRARVALRKARKMGNGGTYTVVEWGNLCSRYGNRCLACGMTEPTIALTPDHIVPISRGGSNDISNIQPLCMRCNQKKHAKSIDYRPA